MASSSVTRPVELSPQPAAARLELTRLIADEPWEGDVDGVLLAVHEAMVNSQRHGGGVTHVSACVDRDNVVVQISDRGKGFHVPRNPASVDVNAERGRGLFLIRRLADDVQVARAGAEVRLTLRFGR